MTTSDTVEPPPAGRRVEPLVGPWYSREDCAQLVRDYLSCDTLAEEFWCSHLNAAFAKGSQIGYGRAEEALVPVLNRLQERLEAGCTIAFQDGLWHLFLPDGNGFVSGITLKKMLFELVFVE